jgi:hypothetical protein
LPWGFEQPTDVSIFLFIMLKKNDYGCIKLKKKLEKHNGYLRTISVEDILTVGWKNIGIKFREGKE